MAGKLWNCWILVKMIQWISFYFSFCELLQIVKFKFYKIILRPQGSICQVVFLKQFFVVAETAMKILTSIDKKDIFKNEGNLLRVTHTLCALVNFSDASLEFAKVSIYITMSLCFDCALVV